MSSSSAGGTGAGLLVAAWTQPQVQLVREMRSVWVAHGTRLLREHHSSLYSSNLLRLDQADAVGVDERLQLSQQGVVRRLDQLAKEHSIERKSQSQMVESTRGTDWSSSLRRTEREHDGHAEPLEVLRFTDESFALAVVFPP